METVSVAQLRRYVVAHQGYATRFRRARAADVAATVRRLGCVQLDSISTVGRAHRLTLWSRDRRTTRSAPSRGCCESGRIFEYWAHEACLVPIEDYPLFKRRMEHLRERHWWGRKHDHDPEVKERVLDALRATRRAADPVLRGRRRRRHVELEAGEADPRGPVRRRRGGGLRPRRVPAAVRPARAGDPARALEAPVPSEEEFRRGYALRAVQGRGALTESGIAEHCRFQGGIKAMRPVVDALVAEGLVRRVAVDDGGPPVVVPADAEIDGAPTGGVLLCPFDNLVWDRAFLERVFGFDARDRGLQAGAAAGVRLLRAAVPVRRPAGRAGRPEVRPGRGRAARARRSTSSRRCGARARSRPRSTRRSTGSRACSSSSTVASVRVEVSPEEARRIAVRAQLLDGSAGGVLDTVRRLGFLQIDPISTVAPPQYLVLWSRLGPYDREELDRLLWEERKLVEFDAFIYPVEDLPLLLARAMRRRARTTRASARIAAFLKENAAFRRYVLRELERRGPLLSREIEDHKRFTREDAPLVGRAEDGR